MEKEIRLSEEMFTALLVGKKLEQNFHKGDGSVDRITIYPPHYGLYLTHAQLAEMRNAAYQSGLMAFVDLMDKITNENH